MKVTEITVGGLLDFIKSDEYKQLEIKPITPLRAISQYKNPNANPNDIALIYASNNCTLLGFVGLIPDAANNKRHSKIYSNSGWWINQDYGKNIGLTIFLKAFQLCDQKMFFTDCTPHTKTILNKTGLFTFSQPVKGKRYFMRFYLADLLRKKTQIKILIQIIQFIDLIFNSSLQVFKFIFQKRIRSTEYSIRSIQSIDKNLEKFITIHSEKTVLKAAADKLNWIIKYPWITTRSEKADINYPFSHIVDSFKQEFLVIEKNNKTVALLFLSIRSNHAQIPYFYITKGIIEDITPLLMQYLSNKKVNSLIIFNPKLIETIKKKSLAGIFNKNITKYTGYSNDIDEIVKKKNFQDGDGDIAFT